MTIVVTASLTATNADVLSGTQLDQTPMPGTYTILAASTVADSTITVSLGGVTVINGQVLSLRANGVPSFIDDLPIIMIGQIGTRPVINIIEVTAMTALVIVLFEPGA